MPLKVYSFLSACNFLIRLLRLTSRNQHVIYVVRVLELHSKENQRLRCEAFVLMIRWYEETLKITVTFNAC